MQIRLAGTLVELAEKQSMDGSISTMDEDDSLLESQPVSLGTTAPLEYSVPFSKKLTFLVLYFVLNLSLTLSNKAIMQKAREIIKTTKIYANVPSDQGSVVTYGHARFSNFHRLLNTRCNWALEIVEVGWQGDAHLAWLLVALYIEHRCQQFISVSSGCVALKCETRRPLTDAIRALVSVPFHQIARSTCPIATVLIYRFVFKRTYERQTYLSMLPLIGGVGLATVGDYYVTMTGFAFTVLGVLLASIKSVTTNRLMTGPLALSPMEVLFRMSPLAAAQCLFYAWISGEFSELKPAMQDGLIGITLITMLAFNATVAFFLNSVSFQTNKLAGALTMSVCGNLKQCLTIVLGIILFSIRVTALNGFGMGVALVGAAWYSRVELQSKGKR